MKGKEEPEERLHIVFKKLREERKKGQLEMQIALNLVPFKMGDLYFEEEKGE